MHSAQVSPCHIHVALIAYTSDCELAEIKQPQKGEPSKLKIAENWEKFPSGDDPPTPYPTWDLFELGNFSKWNDPPLNGTWEMLKLGNIFRRNDPLQNVKTI